MLKCCAVGGLQVKALTARKPNPRWATEVDAHGTAQYVRHGTAERLEAREASAHLTVKLRLPTLAALCDELGFITRIYFRCVQVRSLNR